MQDPEVLVAVGNPDYAEQLVRTAGDLARVREGSVRIVTVVVKPRGSPFGMFTDETITREFAGDRREILDRARSVAPADVPVEAELVVAGSVSDGVLRAAAQPATTALLIGWHGPTSRTEAVLGTSVDTILRRAPCDVYVERIGRIAESVETILLPVAGGPHVRPAATVARAVASANDARVRILTVVTPAADRKIAEGWLAEGVETFASVPGSDVDVEATIEDADEIEDALLAAADTYDIVVFGVSRRGTFRGRLVGSIPRNVGDRIDGTVLLARAADCSRGRVRSLFERVRRSRA